MVKGVSYFKIGFDDGHGNKVRGMTKEEFIDDLHVLEEGDIIQILNSSGLVINTVVITEV